MQTHSTTAPIRRAMALVLSIAIGLIGLAGPLAPPAAADPPPCTFPDSWLTAVDGMPQQAGSVLSFPSGATITVTLTGTAASGCPLPTGTAELWYWVPDGTTVTIASTTFDASGVATFTNVSVDIPEPRLIKVHHLGDAVYTNSGGDWVGLDVPTGPSCVFPSTTLTSVNGIPRVPAEVIGVHAGDTVTVTEMLTPPPGCPMPTGFVELRYWHVDWMLDTRIALAPVDANGLATFTNVSVDIPEPRLLNVHYLGDSVYTNPGGYWIDFDLLPTAPVGIVIDVSSASVDEGDKGDASDVPITVTLSQPAPTALDIELITLTGTADGGGGNEYQVRSRPVHFPAGKTTRTVDFVTYGDHADEVDEYFGIAVDPSSLPPGYVTGTPGTVTITDDDDPATLYVAGTQLTEGDKPIDTRAYVQLAMTSSLERDLIVTWAAVDGTATVPDDYRAVSRTSTVRAGTLATTVEIVTNSDNKQENDEMFQVVILSITSGNPGTNPFVPLDGINHHGDVLIHDDDH